MKTALFLWVFWATTACSQEGPSSAAVDAFTPESAAQMTEAQLRVALKGAPKSVPLNYRLALTLVEAGKYQEAIASAQTVIALDPGHKKAMQLQAIAYADAKEQIKSAEKWAAITDKFPNDTSARSLAGLRFSIGGDETRAQTQFQKHVDKDPNAWKSMIHLTVIAEQLGQPSEVSLRLGQLAALRRSGVIASTEDPMFNRDEYTLADLNIIVYQYYELTGENSRRYIFNVRRADTVLPTVRTNQDFDVDALARVGLPEQLSRNVPVLSGDNQRR